MIYTCTKQGSIEKNEKGINRNYCINSVNAHKNEKGLNTLRAKLLKLKSGLYCDINQQKCKNNQQKAMGQPNSNYRPS